MEWTIKLEAKDGWGEVQTFEAGRLARRVLGLTADEIGLMLDEVKAHLAELQRRMVETQIEERIAGIRVCTRCLRPQPILGRRTRTLRSLFGTVRAAAPRIRLCACIDKASFEAMSFSPLADLLPDRRTPELRPFQAALGAWHSCREATRILATFLPCSPPNHASVRNRLHRVADAVEETEAETGAARPSSNSRSREPGAGESVVVLIAMGRTFALHQATKPATSVRGRPDKGSDDRQQGARFADAVEHARWRLWHGQLQRALDLIGGTVAALAAVTPPVRATAGKVVKLLGDLETDVAGHSELTSTTRRRVLDGQPISTAPTESTVQWLLHRRMGANRQMRWSPHGAHMMLKVRTAVANGTLKRGYAAAERWARRPFRRAA